MSDDEEQAEALRYARQVNDLVLQASAVYTGELIRHSPLSAEAARCAAFVQFRMDQFTAATRACGTLRAATLPDIDSIAMMVRCEVRAMSCLADAATECDLAFRAWGDAMLGSFSEMRKAGKAGKDED